MCFIIINMYVLDTNFQCNVYDNVIMNRGKKQAELNEIYIKILCIHTEDNLGKPKKKVFDYEKKIMELMGRFVISF